MKEKIKKTIFNELSKRTSNKHLHMFDLQVAFQTATGEKLGDFMEDLQSAVDELEQDDFARFEKLPNKTFRVVRGVDFDKWESEMRQGDQKSEINIDTLNADNVQVGDNNTLNINNSPDDLVAVLQLFIDKPEQGKSLLDKLKGYIAKGASLADSIRKLFELAG